MINKNAILLHAQKVFANSAILSGNCGASRPVFWLVSLHPPLGQPFSALCSETRMIVENPLLFLLSPVLNNLQ